MSTEKTAKIAATARAKARTIEQHPDTFHQFAKEEYEKAGFEYVDPRQAEKDRARAQLEKLLAEHPDLAPATQQDFSDEMVERQRQIDERIAAATSEGDSSTDEPWGRIDDAEIPEGQNPYEGSGAS